MTTPILLRFTYLALSFMLLLSESLFAQDIAINEVMASNATNITDEDGDHEDWIELYNYGTTAIDLAGYGLSDDYSSPFKWIFPAITLDPNQFILVWASGKDRTTPGQPLHSNFKIGADGEEIILTRIDGELVDELAPIPIPTDLSYGRLPDGTGNWFYYSLTTPNAPNSAIIYSPPPEPPVFSHTSGFYTDDITLTISHPNSEVVIVYSLDGSEPLEENLSGVSYHYKNQYPQNPGQASGPLLTNTYTSHTYTAPLQITDRSGEANKLANISSTWHFTPDYLPAQPIKKATIVKARAVLNSSSSNIVTHTYFVSSNLAFNSKLPIVSIGINEDALFDYDDGIYVAGMDFDNWRILNPSGITTGHMPANYRRRGTETEKPATFQYFVDGEEVMNQKIGLRLHGNFSKSAQNKTFRLYARAEYDTKNTFDHPFFGATNSSSFKRLLLRNSGNDVGNQWIGQAQIPTISPAVYFRDAFIQKMVSHLRFDTQDYLPTVTYVNGEYWGLLNMRERYDRHYLERKYGILETELDLLGGNAVVSEGENAHYIAMRDYITNNNLANAPHYEYVKTLMDLDNFMDYNIAQIYARNTDWPGNNIEYFRKRTTKYEPDAPYGQDGRWRWLMFDTDHGFGWSGGESYTHNSLLNASSDNSWSRVILRKLLENVEFRNNFINRYADLLNTTFLPERLIGLIDQFAGNIADEIPSHRERWNTLHNWENHVQAMRIFATERPTYARSHIRNQFGVSRNLTASLNVSGTDHGYIQINTIKINESTPGVSAHPYPWTGVYFHNIPITIKAIPNPGYAFSHWSGASQSTAAAITLSPTENFALQANFVSSQNTDQEVLHFWLLDNTIANDTPLKSLNATYSLHTTPAGMSFASSLGAGYPFAIGHPNWRKGSMERRNAPTPLNYYPVVNNDLEYGSFEMRGIQVKEPFLGNGVENSLVFNFSTEGYNRIEFSFAAMDEGAAQELIIDYRDPAANMWINTGLTNPTLPLTSNYKRYAFDFSSVSLANNNADFKIRLRFAGVDMAKDNGNRVTFNNFAVYGTSMLHTNTEGSLETNLFTVYPNPTTNQIKIKAEPSLLGTDYGIYTLIGKEVLRGVLFNKITIVELRNLPAGVYLIYIGTSMKQTFKVIRQ